MVRWWILALPGALVAAAAAAQGLDPGDTYEGTDASGPSDAAALYEDVRLLTTVRVLALTEEQLDRLHQLNQDVLAEREGVAELRGELWDEYQDDFDAVIDAWVSGERVPGRSKRAADNAVAKLRAALRRLAEAEADAGRSLLRVLSDGQRGVVESQQAAERRQARTERMGGIEGVGEFVAVELDAIRDLMPDEYQMLAAVEAMRIATAIAGPNSPDLEPITINMLDMFERVRVWTPPQYQEQRESLPAQIEAALGIAQSAGGGIVSWDDIMRLVRSPRTASVIELVRQGGGGEVE